MKLLTLARDLKRRRGRELKGLFVAEGVRAVEALLESPLALTGALVSTSLGASPRGAALRERMHARGVPELEVTDREFATAASTESPQGVLVLAEVPHRELESAPLRPRARVLVLDAVQDPGNVGTMLRTAQALGVDVTVALPGTVDLWNAKVVRSAMGAIFSHFALAGTWAELDAFRSAHAIPLWAADAGGEPADALEAAVPASLGLIVGNEGAGLSDEARLRAQRRVAIRIAPGVESLNVAVAAGILLHHFRP